MYLPKPITLDGKEIEPCALKQPVIKKGGCSYTKEQKRIYNAYYREVVLKQRKKNRKPLTPDIQHPVFLFNPNQDTDTICSVFGCANKLSPQETLFGSTCISCQQKKGKNDPTLFTRL